MYIYQWCIILYLQNVEKLYIYYKNLTMKSNGTLDSWFFFFTCCWTRFQSDKITRMIPDHKDIARLLQNRKPVQNTQICILKLCIQHNNTEQYISFIVDGTETDILFNQGPCRYSSNWLISLMSTSNVRVSL